MKRLILRELKKIFKSKATLILLIILTIGCAISIYFNISNYSPIYEEQRSYANLQGEKINHVEAAKLVDKILHGYAGEWNQEKINQINQDFYDLLKEYPRNEFDESSMKKIYGNDYLDYVRNVEENGCDEDEFRERMDKNNVKSYSFMTDEDGNIILNYYYKNDPILSVISLAYEGNDSSIFQGSHGYWNQEINEILKNKRTLLIDVDGRKMSTAGIIAQRDDTLSKEQRETLIDYIQNEMNELPSTFDSSVPNNIFMSQLQFVLLIQAFVVVVILANVFGIEKQYGMDMIIYPTKVTKYKIVIAKFIAGFLIALGVLWSQILVSLLVTYLILPIHNWNIAVMAMGGTQIEDVIITYSNLFLQTIVLSTIGTLAIAFITMILSYITKNRFIVVISMFVFLGFNFILQDLSLIPSIIRALHPYNLMNFMNYFIGSNSCSFGFPYMFIGNHIMLMRTLIVGIWIVIILVGCCLAIRNAKKPYIES